MATNPFHEIRLDPYISWESTIGPSYKTAIHDVPSGDEFRTSGWDKGRLMMTISKELMDRPTVFALESFFRARKGSRFAFRVRYWNLYLRTDEPLPLLTNTTAQLQLVFPDAIAPETMLVKKPVLAGDVHNTNDSLLYAPDITLKKDGVAFASSGNWTIDRTTGIITFGTSQAGHTFTWSGSFDIPMRFNTDQLSIKRTFMDDHSWDDFQLIEVKV